MRQWCTTKYGSDFDHLELQEAPEPPAPGPGEITVEVGAVGFASTDLLLMKGGYPGMEHSLPHPLGLEFAGTVKALGPDVSKVAVGARVCGIVFPPQAATADRIVVNASDVGIIPDSFSFGEGAAIPSSYMTAHDALHRHGSLRSGERVLVLAAGGGLGLAAVQLAKLAGAEVYGAASASKLDAVREAGAAAYDYGIEGWESDLPPLDLIIDPIGGESFSRSYEMLDAGGRLICLDVLSRYPEDGETDYRREPTDRSFHPIDLIADGGKSIVGINMPALWPRDGGMGPLLEDALSYFRSNPDLRPLIAESYAFDEIADALRHVKERRNIGRVVLRRT